MRLDGVLLIEKPKDHPEDFVSKISNLHLVIALCPLFLGLMLTHNILFFLLKALSY